LNFLAIDTSSNACSVAAQSGDTIVNRHVVEARAHTRILIPLIRELLDELKIDITDLNAVILGNGPGSFIGMRIGASVAQGLCFGLGIKVIPISSLAVVAAEAFAKHRLSEVAIAQDARMGDVYFGYFKRGVANEPVLVEQECILPAANLHASIDVMTVAGDAWNRYPDSMAGFENRRVVEQLPILTPSAEYLLVLGSNAYAQSLAIDAAALRPAYLRTKVAEKPGRSSSNSESAQ